MPEKTEELNIYQKLAKVRKSVEVLQRNKSGYGYKYVSEDEILSKITGLMDKYGISLLPGIVPGTTTVTPYSYKKTKVQAKTNTLYEENVNEIIVQADTVYTWVNNNNPEERVVVPWSLVGQQADASQSFGSGLSYTFRYFLLKYFDVSTPEDSVDEWRSKQQKAEEAEEKAIVDELIGTLDALIKDFISSNPDKIDDVKKFCTKYVKSGDYFKIGDQVMASKILADFNNTFLKENT